MCCLYDKKQSLNSCSFADMKQKTRNRGPGPNSHTGGCGEQPCVSPSIFDDGQL